MNNNDPREDPVSQKPPFSVPYEQYSPQEEGSAPVFYQVPPPPTGQYVPSGTPEFPSASAPGWAAPTQPPPAAGPYYYPPPYTPPMPATPGKKHTARNVAIFFIVLCLLIGGIIGLFALLIPHKAVTTHVSPVQSSATGTANAVDPYPSYLPGHGNLALDDPLQHADNWNDTITGHCVFVNNAYHVRSLTNNVEHICIAQPNNSALKNATDSAFEVQMTIVQGDCGDVAIRISVSDFTGQDKWYFVSICQDGNYGIFKSNVSHLGSDTVRSFAYSAAIKQGINQENIVDLVAAGSTLSLFVNKQQIASVQDTSITQGNFGLGVNTGRHNITEVVYHDAKIWTL